MSDLGEYLRRSRAAWREMSDDERAATRKRYADAGWVLCPHPDCIPHNCTKVEP